MRERGYGVRGAGIDHAAVVWVEVVFGHGVEEDIHMRGDVQMGELQGACEGKDQRDVFGLVGERMSSGFVGRRT